ncbi:MAG: hypothetical protein FWD81_00535 [Methanomassiliicoccaceae archaeon]|nr:hypothetical protein [Methanomassiliicoccaceae archaeon]
MMLGDIIRVVWLVFGNDRLTTYEIESRLEEQFNYRCPDDFAKTLTKLKQAGFVKGEVSAERGGWEWWVDDECRSSDLSKIM